jgi:hypothetical protein
MSAVYSVFQVNSSLLEMKALRTRIRAQGKSVADHTASVSYAKVFIDRFGQCWARQPQKDSMKLQAVQFPRSKPPTNRAVPRQPS